MHGDIRGGRLLTSLVARFSTVHTNHKRIASGAALIGLLLILAKLFVAAREIAIAWRFGVSGLVDAYQLSLTIATWLPMMLTSAMAVVLVPRLVALQGYPERYREFVSELNGSVLASGVILACGTWLAAPAASGIIGPNANHATMEVTIAFSRDIAAIALFILISGYLSARLQSLERFSYSITEAVPAASIALLVLAPFAIGEGARLICGTVVGYGLQIVALCVMTARADHRLGGIRLRHRSPEWSSFYKSMVLMGLAQLLITSALPIDQAFASRIGEGAVASLGYANRTLTLAMTLGAVMISRALLPVLSRMVASGQVGLARRQALQWSALMFGIGIMGAAVVWTIAPQLVRLLFERGEFNPQASARVTEALRYGIIQLPPFFGGIALVQFYSAAGRFRSFLVITSCALLVKIALNVVLTPIYGLGGIMISTGCMYFMTGFLLWMGLTEAAALATRFSKRRSDSTGHRAAYPWDAR